MDIHMFNFFTSSVILGFVAFVSVMLIFSTITPEHRKGAMTAVFVAMFFVIVTIVANIQGVYLPLYKNLFR